MYLRLQETEEQITAANMQGLQIKSKYSTLHAPFFLLYIYLHFKDTFPQCVTKRVFSYSLKSQKELQYLSHRMFAAYAWNIKCRRKKKLIAQLGGKLRDERFEPN